MGNVQAAPETELTFETNTVAVQVDIEEEKSASILQSPKFVSSIIRFDVLIEEWKKEPSGRGTQTKRPITKQIKDIFFVPWLKPFLIKLALFISSTYDVTSDGVLANSFIRGTIYTKYVDNMSDPGGFHTYYLYAFSSLHCKWLLDEFR